MNLSTLRPAKGSVKDNKRKGRGQGSGRGGTSTKGHKGDKSRSGYKQKKGFEGGQMPIQRRLPKSGFKNINRIEYSVVNLDKLQAISEKHKVNTLDVAALRKYLNTSKEALIKVLASGSLKAKLDIKAHAFSVSAAKAIEATGGKIEKAKF